MEQFYLRRVASKAAQDDVGAVVAQVELLESIGLPVLDKVDVTVDARRCLVVVVRRQEDIFAARVACSLVDEDNRILRLCVPDGNLSVHVSGKHTRGV